MTGPKPTLTIAEACELLAEHDRPMTARQLRNRVAHGAVPAFMDGRRLMFLRSALLAALAENVL